VSESIEIVLLGVSGGPFDPRGLGLRPPGSPGPRGRPERAPPLRRRRASLPVSDERLQERPEADALRGPEGKTRCLKLLQPKVFGVKFSLREIGRIFPPKYAILSLLKCLNYKI